MGLLIPACAATTAVDPRAYPLAPNSRAAASRISFSLSARGIPFVPTARAAFSCLLMVPTLCQCDHKVTYPAFRSVGRQ